MITWSCERGLKSCHHIPTQASSSHSYGQRQPPTASTAEADGCNAANPAAAAAAHRRLHAGFSTAFGVPPLPSGPFAATSSRARVLTELVNAWLGVVEWLQSATGETRIR